MKAKDKGENKPERMENCAAQKGSGGEKVMAKTRPRRYVVAAPPSEHAGIGSALRQAFTLPERASTRMFELLLERLNRRNGD